METGEKRIMKQALMIAASFVAFLWMIEILEFLSPTPYSFLGIFPRRVENLTGIITGPLIHGDWGHIWSNTGPLFVTTAAILYLYHEIAWKVMAWIYAMTGIWVWIAAAPAYHIGASGLVYGFAGFLFFSGLLRREKRSIAISLLVAFLYGGLVWGIFPGQEGISWESHLFGAIAGVGVAFAVRKQGPQREKYAWEDEPEEEDPRDAHAYWNYENKIESPRQITYYYRRNDETANSEHPE